MADATVVIGFLTASISLLGVVLGIGYTRSKIKHEPHELRDKLNTRENTVTQISGRNSVFIDNSRKWGGQ
jgi:hypothetical protein